jgi:hypothetical protein
MQVELENLGPGTAHSVAMTMFAKLSTPWLTIPDQIVSYGDLPEGTSSAGGQDSYALDLGGWPGGSFYVGLELAYEDGNATQHTTTLTLLVDPGGPTGVID